MNSERKTELEQRLEAVLSNVEGVGKVKVLIMTEEEHGDFYSGGSERVTGVVVVAQGADNILTVQNIKEAVMALFEVDAHKIKIMKMKQGELL